MIEKSLSLTQSGCLRLVIADPIRSSTTGSTARSSISSYGISTAPSTRPAIVHMNKVALITGASSGTSYRLDVPALNLLILILLRHRPRHCGCPIEGRVGYRDHSQKA